MTLTAILTFAGGIGLFLIGMRMMTDGLKVAAGNTLRDILVKATRSRIRGVLSGILITTMVQSSSAVIFATIGFVNAGLLTLGQAIGIIYGSNIGTTLTSWIVALVGFNVNLQALALPAIGIGTGLWIAGGVRRHGALGQALAGLGLFFLGLDILKNTFAGAGEIAVLEAWADLGMVALLLFMLAGTMLTVLMQSSSAALAVTLTAAAGGVIPLESAAAMVIGANVGTTSTALFAIIGATPAAKRAAIAHVAFNVITAIVSLAALPLLLTLVDGFAWLLGLESQPATLLAILHTMTKLLGLLIMWPLTNQLVKQLEKCFTHSEQDEARPHYLDRNIQATPALALDALALELNEMGKLARRLAWTALSSEAKEAPELEQGLHSLEKLSLAVGEFAAGIPSQEHDPVLKTALPSALRIAQYYVDIAEQAIELHQAKPRASIENHGELAEEIHHLFAQACELVETLGGEDGRAEAAAMEEMGLAFERQYSAAKNSTLMAGARGKIAPSRMAGVLEQLSALHHIASQSLKAVRYMEAYNLARKAPGESQEEPDTETDQSHDHQPE